MQISFKKLPASPTDGIALFWKFVIQAKSPVVIQDYFAPELFFDYFFIKQGAVRYMAGAQGRAFKLPQQALKTIQTRPLTFEFSTPLTMYGARLSLPFAESFWGELKANQFVKQAWVEDDAGFESFAKQVTARLKTHQRKKLAYPMLSSDLNESNWLTHYSARHKRRLYASVFGVSRTDLLNIRNVQLFLAQACDFASHSPRIIQHVNPDVFYDQPHLNRLFKKMTGFSPVGYFEVGSLLHYLLHMCFPTF